MSKAIIHTASLAHSEVIASILYQAFIEYKPLYTPEGFALTTPTARQIEDRWHQGTVWIAMIEDRIAGTVSAVPNGPSLHIRSMAVLPAYQGQGIARALLAYVEGYALQQGFETLDLETTPFLSTAIRLYGRFGFRKTSDSDLAGTPLFTMEKQISQQRDSRS